MFLSFSIGGGCLFVCSDPLPSRFGVSDHLEEFTRSKDGDWEVYHMGEEMIAMMLESYLVLPFFVEVFFLLWPPMLGFCCFFQAS